MARCWRLQRPDGSRYAEARSTPSKTHVAMPVTSGVSWLKFVRRVDQETSSKRWLWVFGLQVSWMVFGPRKELKPPRLMAAAMAAKEAKTCRHFGPLCGEEQEATFAALHKFNTLLSHTKPNTTEAVNRNVQHMSKTPKTFHAEGATRVRAARATCDRSGSARAKSQDACARRLRFTASVPTFCQ